ncbi:MAG: HDOD domain-containing protein [Opitutus sp.]|nr:HDOD domain-containing protein [Opitutus sp.]
MITDLAITRAEFLAHAQELPAAPQVLGGLCELLADVNTGLGQISDEIRRDPALAARVIRLSNSVIFGGGGGVSSIDEAVNRVGFAEIIRIVGVATVAGLVDRSLQLYGVEAERLRESLLLHALASEALAAAAAIDPRAAYAAGLLRGVGMMVLDRTARRRIATTEIFDQQQFTTYAEWERVRFGLTGDEAAAVILDEWRFPPDLVGAIAQHRIPGENPLANVLNLAGSIVTAGGLALAGEEACWRLEPERLAAAGLDHAQWQDACVQTHLTFTQQRGALY